MQYILTEEEYNKLIADNAKKTFAAKRKFENLCQHVADHLPIKGTWGQWKDEPMKHPWGCIHSTTDEWYCDDCPMVDYCTMNKEFSK